jgi:nitroimidazol reductase NimA-like FMN-containing flavoprotein (pyridoxamine 5'-phosphate oxidase superfamily)
MGESAPPGSHPAIRSLSADEVTAILTRNHLGRIAYDWQNQIDIQPIHYVYSDGSLYARTTHGEKYRVLGENFYHVWPVAFEVDESESLFQWRSVVVHGNAHLVKPPEQGGDPEEWSSAVAVLRTLLPAAFTPEDPVPERTAVFRIAVQEATGRESQPGLEAHASGRA